MGATIGHMGRRAALPESVRSALANLFGDDIARVEVIENSFFAHLHWKAVATTRRRRIYLRGSAEDFFNDPALMIHEFFHVMKQWEPRLLTSCRYCQCRMKFPHSSGWKFPTPSSHCSLKRTLLVITLSSWIWRCRRTERSPVPPIGGAYWTQRSPMATPARRMVALRPVAAAGQPVGDP